MSLDSSSNQSTIYTNSLNKLFILLLLCFSMELHSMELHSKNLSKMFEDNIYFLFQKQTNNNIECP